MLAIIGGSGFSALPELNIKHRQIFRTPYGAPSCPLLFGSINHCEVVFLARHGFGYAHSPHEINYRANIDALKTAGVSQILALSAVASMRDNILPGSLVLPHDLIDYTHGRENTYYTGEDMRVFHPDFSEPYHAGLRTQVQKWAGRANIAIHDQAVYGCLQGPRLPTTAEVKRLQNDGADVYGMTGMPEAVLAFEKEMAYVHVCGVVGMAGGIHQKRQTPQFCTEPDSAAINKIRTLLSYVECGLE